jgi:choline dehydrogenase
MKRSVDFTPPNNALRPRNASVPFSTSAFTRGAGPLHVSFPLWANSFSSYAKIAFQKLGFLTAIDFVSGTLSGVQYCMNTIDPKGQIRDSSESSFLQIAMRTTAIKVYNNTMAKRIILDGKRASGAVADSGGVEYTLLARKEVILSAGVVRSPLAKVSTAVHTNTEQFQSPQMLMVSGIGPADTLKRFNIPIVSDLKGVGQNLDDHILFGASYQVKTLTHSALGNVTYSALATEQYKTNGSGMLGNPGGEIIAWEKLPPPLRNSLSASTRASLAKFPPDWPEVEYLVLDAYSGDNQNLILGAPRTPFMYASPAAGIITSQSRGSVTISSADAAVPPVIDPNWLTDPADQELAVAAFKRMRQMMDTDVMKKVWVEEVVPGRNVSSDAEILNGIRQNGIQLFHASATCKYNFEHSLLAGKSSQKLRTNRYT